MFLLATYIDGDRWPSAFEPLLYPTGISFYRPFSYREEYFHPIQTAQQLSDPSQREALLGQPTWNWGFFGIRFRRNDTYLPRFIPLRRITITEVRSADVLNLRFKMGGFVKPTLDQGKRALPRFDLAGSVPDIKETKLFIHTTEALAETASQLAIVDEFPAHFWQCLEQEFSPETWDKVRNAFLLRLGSVRKRGKTENLTPEKIDSAANVFGYAFRAGNAYDLGLSHYRIIQQGKEVPAAEHQFVLSNPFEEVTSSKKGFQLLGNYRDDDLWVKPQNPSDGPIDLAFESTRLDQPQAFVDPASSRMIGLKIPVSVAKKGWALIRWINLLLFLVGGISSIFLFRVYGHADDKTQKAVLIIIAAMVSVAINSLKDFFSPKE